MSEWPPIRIIASIICASFLLLQIAVADVEAPTFQYIARRLLPNECQSIINSEIEEPSNVISPVSKIHKLPSNGIDCFRKLVSWASNLRINRRDAQFVLENRLRRIGRNDLATWLDRSIPRGRTATEDTIEYNSWNSKKESNRNLMSSSDPTISELDKLMYGPPRIKSIAGLSPEFRQQSVSTFPDLRKLNGIHSPDSFKDRYLVMAAPESGHQQTSAPGYIPTPSPSGIGNVAGSSSAPKENDSKDSNSPQIVDGILSEEKKHNKSKILPHFTDEKNSPCLRVPLSTALVVIGTIMILTCCCALLLRNRLVACFERLRGKKTNNKTSKRLSMDEEQGFMGPRTFGKAPKRSGRKGGGSMDVANVGVQNNNVASTVSGESDEKPTGCSNCCGRKNKKNKRKWKK